MTRIQVSRFAYSEHVIRIYIRIVGAAINMLEHILFWPRVGRFLKSIFLVSHLKSDPLIIVDVGINRGQSTLLFLKWFPEARVHGFEPLPEVFLVAERRIRNRAYLYNLGISSISGVRTFWQAKFDETSTFNPPNLESKYHKMKSKVLLSTADTMYTALTVKTITINDFSSNEKIGRIDLLKVDTEGHELEVLKGATTLLKSQQIKLIQVERQETGLRSTEGLLNSPEEVEIFLKSFSYVKVKTISHVFASFYDDFYMQNSK